MSNVIQMPLEKNRIRLYAQNYVQLYVEKGWMDAGHYWTEVIPSQFYKQAKVLIAKEFKERGVNVKV